MPFSGIHRLEVVLPVITCSWMLSMLLSSPSEPLLEGTAAELDCLVVGAGPAQRLEGALACVFQLLQKHVVRKAASQASNWITTSGSPDEFPESIQLNRTCCEEYVLSALEVHQSRTRHGSDGVALTLVPSCLCCSTLPSTCQKSLQVLWACFWQQSCRALSMVNSLTLRLH